MRRFWPVLALVFLLGCMAEQPADELKTVIREPARHQLDRPDANMTALERLDFAVGRSFFRNPWVQAPASTDARDGLGPMFNALSCTSCHIGSGRGLAAVEQQPLKTHVVRLSVLDYLSQQFVAELRYGEQLQGQALPGVKPEGLAKVSFVTQTQQLSDKEVLLRKPQLRIENLAYGSMSEQVKTSLRMAPGLAGLGLLESVPEAQLLAWADPDDLDEDGISGRANRVWDISAQQYRMGRFGWKAEQPTVKQQSAAAFHADLGISSRLFAGQSCTKVQLACRRQPTGGEPEISDRLLDRVTLYVANLAVPKARAEYPAGKALFHQAGCAQCHRPNLTVASSDYPWLAGRSISPYTDLLLHDMGEGLADNRPVAEASGREWRTPPLWGIGIAKQVAPKTGFLHDGRASNLMEAILWHGGEAESSRQAVQKMSADERRELITFIETL